MVEREDNICINQIFKVWQDSMCKVFITLSRDESNLFLAQGTHGK